MVEQGWSTGGKFQADSATRIRVVLIPTAGIFNYRPNVPLPVFDVIR